MPHILSADGGDSGVNKCPNTVLSYRRLGVISMTQYYGVDIGKSRIYLPLDDLRPDRAYIMFLDFVGIPGECGPSEGLPCRLVTVKGLPNSIPESEYRVRVIHGAAQLTGNSEEFLRTRGFHKATAVERYRLSEYQTRPFGIPAARPDGDVQPSQRRAHSDLMSCQMARAPSAACGVAPAAVTTSGPSFATGIGTSTWASAGGVAGVVESYSDVDTRGRVGPPTAFGCSGFLQFLSAGGGRPRAADPRSCDAYTAGQDSPVAAAFDFGSPAGSPVDRAEAGRRLAEAAGRASVMATLPPPPPYRRTAAVGARPVATSNVQEYRPPSGQTAVASTSDRPGAEADQASVPVLRLPAWAVPGASAMVPRSGQSVVPDPSEAPADEPSSADPFVGGPLLLGTPYGWASNLLSLSGEESAEETGEGH